LPRPDPRPRIAEAPEGKGFLDAKTAPPPWIPEVKTTLATAPLAAKSATYVYPAIPQAKLKEHK
jgi:hypothetical protein